MNPCPTLLGVQCSVVLTDNPPAGSDQKDPFSALVDQLHGGIQLRPTTLGNVIRGRDSTPGQQSLSLSSTCQQ